MFRHAVNGWYSALLGKIRTRTPHKPAPITDGRRPAAVKPVLEPMEPRVLMSAFSPAAMPGISTPLTVPDSAPVIYVANDGGAVALSKVVNGVASPLATGFSRPIGVAVDSQGNIYVANQDVGTVSKVTPGGSTTTFASGFSDPEGIAFDSHGNLYVANNGDGIISKITPGGSVSSFAGGLPSPQGLVFDAGGNLYVSNFGADTINKITPGGMVSTFVSASAGLSNPYGLAIDKNGIIYVANDFGNNIDKISPTGMVTTFVSSIPSPAGLAFGSNGTLYETENGDTGGSTISAITPGGSVSTYATGLDDTGFLATAENTSNAVATIHASDLGGVYNGKPFPATGYVAGTGGGKIATPVFTYYLAGDKTFSHPLSGAPSTAGSYVFVATFAGNSAYLPTQTTAPFTIAKAPSVIHASDLGGAHTGKPYPATGYVAGIGGAKIATPVFTYYLASDTTFSDPLSGPPSSPGSYVFVATFVGNSDYLPAKTTAHFSIRMPV